MSALDRLTIKGFKSIQSLEQFELRNLNIIVGANGAGKSNFIAFFRMLRSFMLGNLSTYVARNGGFNGFLFRGPKVTKEIFFEMHFGDRGYRFYLTPTANNSCIIEKEARFYKQSASQWWELGDSIDGTSLMVKECTGTGLNAYNSRYIYDAISSWQVYHVHDTSAFAGMRLPEITQRGRKLAADASNLAAHLLYLRQLHPVVYTEIVNAVRLVAPYFDDFLLTVDEQGSEKKVALDWRQKDTELEMQPYHLSDGTIRFICLATALLQPNPPSTIIIDEPELGLHPSAISVLAELIEVASRCTQVIVATQSPLLLDYFSIEDIVVANRKNGSSTFERLKADDYKEWFSDFTLGELWIKNVIAGGPNHE